MPTARLFAVTSLAMVAFAGNSVLCRLALSGTGIDAATFTALRIGSGAVVLAALSVLRAAPSGSFGGSWRSAGALFTYAAAFSFAYVRLSTGMGALLLFGAVQATMIGYGLATGERFGARQLLGLLLALTGVIVLVLPGVSAPSPVGAVLMVSAGVAWGVYSLRGRGKADPTRETAGNFARAVPFAALLSLLFLPRSSIDVAGATYAVASGAVASGLGYAVWYSALPFLAATSAATVQLTVPVLAALGGVAFLGEVLTLRLVLSGSTILGGVALFISGVRARTGS